MEKSRGDQKLDFDLNFFNGKECTPYFIAGCDEVGRGPLAGPVVAACVFIAIGEQIESCEQDFKDLLNEWKRMGVGDSKKIKEQKRQDIIRQFIDVSPLKLECGKAFLIQSKGSLRVLCAMKKIEASEIDEINILQASLKAMKLAFGLIWNEKSKDYEKGVVLIDGNKKFKLDAYEQDQKAQNDLNSGQGVKLESVVKGDSKSLIIGLASIFAKEYRDQLMKIFAEKYPGFGWEKNAGYPTGEHMNAIARLGVTPFHRKSFKGVKEIGEVYADRGLL